MIVIVGAGCMGGALLKGFLAAGNNTSSVTVVDPHLAASQSSYEGAALVNDIFALDGSAIDMVLFAVKPFIIAEIIADYAKHITSNPVYTSVIAGKSLAFYQGYLGDKVAFVRSMPNIAALSHQSVTGLVANAYVTNKQKKLITSFFNSVGKAFWLEDESQIDAVTAISGSGPAYVFYFIECLTAAAKKLGLADDIAADLAFQTVYGSTMLAKESDKNASELRQQVTTPNGTTQAALDVLMDDEGLSALLGQATYAAKQRAIELSD